jgi:hypothetical protein
MDKITAHLEFLGYKSEPLNGVDGLLATSNKYLNFMYQERGFGILFTYLIQTNDNNRKDRSGILNAINTFNSKVVVSRGYVNDDSTYILLEATYPLSYDKTTFGIFIDTIQRDTANVYNEEIGLKNYIN